MSALESLHAGQVLDTVRDFTRTLPMEVEPLPKGETSWAIAMMPWPYLYNSALGEAALITHEINGTLRADPELVDTTATVEYGPWQQGHEASIKEGVRAFGRILDYATAAGEVDLERVPLYSSVVKFTADSLAIRALFRPANRYMLIETPYPIASFMSPQEAAKVLAETEYCVTLAKVSSLILANRTTPELRTGQLQALADSYYATVRGSHSKKTLPNIDSALSLV
jgi:hypothetical protein